MKERLSGRTNYNTNSSILNYPTPNENDYSTEYQPLRKINLIKQPDSCRTLNPSLAVRIKNKNSLKMK